MSCSCHIKALELGPMNNLIYLLQDKITQRIAVIDPAWDTQAILKTAESAGGTITDILLTHSHDDHINRINELLQQTDAQVHLSRQEEKFYGQKIANSAIHDGGEIIQLGDTAIKMLHTPGHTPGSVCYHIGDNLITGDTMFVYGCGHCRLGGVPEDLYYTLKKLAEDLPAHTMIYPGHNYALSATSTMAEEMAGNPYMRQKNVEDFIDFRMNTPSREMPFTAVTS